MGDSKDEYSLGGIVDVQQDSVLADSHSPGVGCAGQFGDAVRPGVEFEIEQGPGRTSPEFGR